MVVKLYLSGISGNKEVKKKQQRVQMILDSKCINYEAIDITEPGREKDKETMQQRAKVREILGKHPLPPQIFNEEDYCGDYEDFDLANEVDELEQFLHLPVPSKITSDDGTDKVNGSREEIARNGAKTTEVNGDVELTSIEPETGPLSDEPEEEAEADEDVNESVEDPQTIEKDAVRNVSPPAEAPETDETLPIGEEEPEIEISSGGDVLPEINTEIPEDNDASGGARVENDEGMVSEFVQNVGVELVTGLGGDEVKESVQSEVVSDIVLNSLEKVGDEEQFREQSVDVKSDDILESFEKEDLAIKSIVSEVETRDASSEVASHPSVIQPVLKTFDRKVVEESAVQVSDVEEKKIQPSFTTSNEDFHTSVEAKIQTPVSNQESAPVLRDRKVAVENSEIDVKVVEVCKAEEKIEPSLTTSNEYNQTSVDAEIKTTISEKGSVLSDQKAVLESSNRDSKVGNEPTIQVCDVEEKIQPSFTTSNEDFQTSFEAKIQTPVSNKESAPVLRDQTVENSDRCGKVVEEATIQVCEVEEKTQPSLSASNKGNQDHQTSSQADIPSPVAEKEKLPVSVDQTAVLKTEIQPKEFEGEKQSNPKEREPDKEPVLGSCDEQQQQQTTDKSDQGVQQIEQIQLISGASDIKVEISELKKPSDVVSDEPVLKFQETNRKVVANSAITSKKLDNTLQDTSKPGPDYQVSQVSYSSEAKEISRIQPKSTAITGPEALKPEKLSSTTDDSNYKPSLKTIEPSRLLVGAETIDFEPTAETTPAVLGGAETSSSDKVQQIVPAEIILNPIPNKEKMETELKQAAAEEAANMATSASDLQEETDVLKPLARRDTLKHIKRPSLSKLSHDDETSSEIHGDGVSFADLLLENHLQEEVDKISFSPQLVSKIISDKNIPKEERGLALKSWNYKPTEVDFVKQVRNLLDDRDNEIICYRARQRAGGYGRMRDPHDHFLSEMNKLVKEYESDEDEIYEVVIPQPPPKIPTPPPMPPVNEFLEEVLRALNAPWHPKPKPEEPKTFVKQVKDLLNTEELSGDGQALYFTKERGPLDDTDMVHKVRIILDEKESSMGIKKHETQTVDHVPFLSDVLVLLNDEPVPDNDAPAEIVKTPILEKIEKPVKEKKTEPEKKWKDIKIAEIFIRDNVFPILARVTSEKYKIFVSALGSERIELTSDDLEAVTITVVEDNGYKSDVAKIRLGIRKRYADKQPVQDSFEAEEPEKEAADEEEQEDE